jgi:hypothetical protein
MRAHRSKCNPIMPDIKVRKGHRRGRGRGEGGRGRGRGRGEDVEKNKPI